MDLGVHGSILSMPQQTTTRSDYGLSCSTVRCTLGFPSITKESDSESLHPLGLKQKDGGGGTFEFLAETLTFLPQA